MPEKTDEDIATDVQRGDAQAFGTLVERYEDKLIRYARRFLRSSDDAEDLVQETFIKAYSNIKGFDTKRRFSPWIYRIAHNEFVNSMRKRSGKENISIFDFDLLFPHPVAKETADDKVNKEELKRMLGGYLEQLDPKYREPIVLYYFEDMDYGEIADILQIPSSTVGVRLRRGKAMLRKLMDKLN
ncbi:MAG: RNA polymerase sigma factor [Patescibacteria group bacterium]|nr:RNA polymerase sigma factor [Patescibacteria group bacterium]MDE2015303.1 RNA polymerase sigma factor [Patescibacteria group bacterium]MDE2227108.1 RNA polymerase sigma factor [Patescibacteria group bacterium]